MAGAGIRVEATGALAGLHDLVARLEHPHPMFEAIGGALLESTQRRFETGSAPDGSVWPQSIRAMVGERGGPTLNDTGRLLDSLTFNASDQGLELGTNVLYAAVQQFGATIRPKAAGGKLAFRLLGRTIFADEVTIPARPFIGLDEDDERAILEIAGDYAVGPNVQKG